MKETFMQAHLLSFEKLAVKRWMRALHGSHPVVTVAAKKSPIPMHSLTHALNIGTLATWMSVAAFGSAGVMLGRAVHLPPIADVAGVELVQTPLEVESVDVADNMNEASDQPASVESIELPAPPEMLPALQSNALPEVPDMPIAEVKKVSEAIKSTAKPASKPAAKPQRSSAVAGNPSAGNNASANGAATMSNAARLAAGRMPAPRYPSEARSKGQAGTVLIEFTVDPSGRVSSAHIATPCPWSVLNQEALRAVKNWKFPPGSVMTFKKPIVFKLRNS
ncbi:MAG: TonB family protein [Verrucomicrobiota bacterium]